MTTDFAPSTILLLSSREAPADPRRLKPVSGQAHDASDGFVYRQPRKA